MNRKLGTSILFALALINAMFISYHDFTVAEFADTYMYKFWEFLTTTVDIDLSRFSTQVVIMIILVSSLFAVHYVFGSIANTYANNRKEFNKVTQGLAGGLVVFIIAGYFFGEPGNPNAVEAVSRIYCATYTLAVLLSAIAQLNLYLVYQRNIEMRKRVQELEEALNSRVTRS